MKTRFIACTAIAVLLLNMSGFALADTRGAKTKKGESGRLIGLLPASDGVAIFDLKRLLNDGLPNALSANQPLLGRITDKLDEMKSRLGIDPRAFGQAAIGVNFKQVSAAEIDYDTVAVMSGDVNFGTVIAAAKLASKGSFRTEKIGDRSIFIFTFAEMIKQHAVSNSNSKADKMIDRLFHRFSKEIALAAIDGKTMAIGSTTRVRETLEAKSRAGNDLVSLLAPDETAVLRFALNPKGSLSQIVPYGEYFGTNTDSIQYLAGSFDVGKAAARSQLMARTGNAEQAAGVKDMIEVAQALKGLIADPKRPERMVYARMLESMKVAVRANDVTLDLSIPQADIDVLVAGIR